jgi:hypothetical protein
MMKSEPASTQGLLGTDIRSRARGGSAVRRCVVDSERGGHTRLVCGALTQRERAESFAR